MNRRSFATILGAGLSGCSRSVDKYELRVGIVTEENEADREKRHQPLAEYLGAQLRMPVSLRQAADYAGVIEAMRSDRLELAFFGPAAYARTWLLTNGGVEPLCAAYGKSGVFGYQSVLAVRTDSAYKTLDDLRGRVVAWADPNSTSGYQAPVYYLRRQGCDPQKFFGKTMFSGSHENGILAVLNGTCEATATWWMDKERGNIQRMELKKMIPRGSTRLVWRSPYMASSPWAMRTSLPTALRLRVKNLLLNLRDQARPVWLALTDDTEAGYRAVTHADYSDIVDMIRANEQQRKPG